jgi:undecaprenyl-diphosphatase
MPDLNGMDERWSLSIRSVERSAWLRPPAILLAHSADPWTSLAGLFLLWFFGDPTWKLLALVFIAGTLITAGIVFTIKYTVRRQRPPGEWGAIYRITNPHSFPSGHAARCMMLAVLGWALAPAWLGWLLFIWAVLVAWARVGMGVHYLSDIVAGASLGLFTGLVTLALYPNLKPLFLSLQLA